jgi:RHS repeat-associated protein
MSSTTSTNTRATQSPARCFTTRKATLPSAAGWTYSYDAQNRLRTMQGPGMTITLTYDPLNRVITRNVNGAVTQNVWEGWNLIEEHRPDWSIQRCYLQGANQNEMVAAFDGGVYTTHWFWQDGRGNTSHITGDAANLFERYTYDLSGAPKFYDEWDNERLGGSVYDTRFLFAGSQYLPETGLYDMRNRFYSPVLNRFLQTDPIGFAGDALNLYRYCGDDPVDRSDPMGLYDQYSRLTMFGGGDWIKGSDGLSASDWNHKQDQPAGNITFAGLWERDGGGKNDKSTPAWYGTAVAAAQSRVKEVGADARTSKATEWISEVGQAKDEKGRLSEKYVAVQPHLGVGIKSGVQQSVADQRNLPAGYRHIVGFVVGYNYYDRTFVSRDIHTAMGANYKVAIIIGEVRGQGNKVIIYEKNKPMPVY